MRPTRSESASPLPEGVPPRSFVNDEQITKDRFTSTVFPTFSVLLEKQVSGYFDLLEKSELSESEKLQLKMYGSLAERCNIRSRDELQRVEKLRRDTSEKAERLNEQMNNCKKLYDTYVGIADTYEKISKGDYISNLIAEKKREDEQKKNVIHKKLR